VLINMFQNCAFMPPALLGALPAQLAELVAELEAALREAAALTDRPDVDAKRCAALRPCRATVQM
jgi:hypothetical protein